MKVDCDIPNRPTHVGVECGPLRIYLHPAVSVLQDRFPLLVGPQGNRQIYPLLPQRESRINLLSFCFASLWVEEQVQKHFPAPVQWVAAADGGVPKGTVVSPGPEACFLRASARRKFWMRGKKSLANGSKFPGGFFTK